MINEPARSRVTVYVSIGNSDNRLTQQDWAEFWNEVAKLLAPGIWGTVKKVHGVWFSAPAAPHQNACWCVELDSGDITRLQSELVRLAGRYRQDSIAWAPAPETLFLGPRPEADQTEWAGKAA